MRSIEQGEKVIREQAATIGCSEGVVTIDCDNKKDAVAVLNWLVGLSNPIKKVAECEPDEITISDVNGWITARVLPVHGDVQIFQESYELKENEEVRMEQSEDIRKLGQWLIAVADWREAQGKTNER